MDTSTVHRTRRGDRVIITCACGEGCAHGSLELRLDRAAEEPQFLLELWFRPADAFWARLRQAWRVLAGRPVFCDLLWGRETARDVADWLLTQSGDSAVPDAVRAKVP